MTKLYAAMLLLLLTQITCVAQEVDTRIEHLLVPNNSNIDFAGFANLSQELIAERARRRVPLERFLEMAGTPGTIVLDTRSKWAFDAVHLRGAIHLNFSDFSAQKLKETIPSQDTRILIYCNNNFKPPRTAQRTDTLKPYVNRNDPSDGEKIIEGTTLKQPSLALNIPTFINLWGYGYKNIYELADSVPLDDPRLPLETSGNKGNGDTGTTN